MNFFDRFNAINKRIQYHNDIANYFRNFEQC